MPLPQGQGSLRPTLGPLWIGAVRVAVAEPGTELWDRLLETTRRVVVFHSKVLPRHAKMGPHAEVEFPVTLTGLERALRPRS